MQDVYIEFLIKLCNSVEGGYKEVADKVGANPMTIYQVINGVKTTTGETRGVGANLRNRITKCYPNWLAELNPKELSTSVVLRDLAKFLKQVPDEKRPELERLLGNLARAPDSSILLETIKKYLDEYNHSGDGINS